MRIIKACVPRVSSGLPVQPPAFSPQKARSIGIYCATTKPHFGPVLGHPSPLGLLRPRGDVFIMFAFPPRDSTAPVPHRAYRNAYRNAHGWQEPRCDSEPEKRPWGVCISQMECGCCALWCILVPPIMPPECRRPAHGISNSALVPKCDVCRPRCNTRSGWRAPVLAARASNESCMLQLTVDLSSAMTGTRKALPLDWRDVGVV